MADVLGFNLGINAPSFNTGSLGTSILWIILIFLGACIAAFFIWQWFQKKTFNKKIVIFENISGHGFQKTGEDTARLIKVGDGGEEILFLKNRKIYRTAYGQKMGPNIYWFAVGKDGYWYNIILGDVDTKLGALDIEPVDRDMRYMHVAIRKNITERYRKIGFMEKYGTMIMGSVFLLIMIIGIWFLIDKLADVARSFSVAAESFKTSNDLLKTALGHLDSICSGGAGYITP